MQLPASAWCIFHSSSQGELSAVVLLGTTMPLHAVIEQGTALTGP